MKGEVAQASVNTQLKRGEASPQDIAERIAGAFPFDLLDDSFVEQAGKMATVYIAIAAFENVARKFVQDRLLEQHGADWWDKNISQEVRQNAEKRKADEAQHRYHGSRGTSMIFYTKMGDLPTIIQKNWADFEGYIPSVEWARQLFGAVERSRNVIMHSGDLSMNDIQRVGMNIRDWLQQVGG
jgi:thymidylate synthase